MPLVLSQLKTEVQTDPTALGYAQWVAVNDLSYVANLLNEVRSTIQVRRSDLSVKDIWEALLITDIVDAGTTAPALSLERKQLMWLGGLSAIGTVRLTNDDGTDTQVLANFKAVLKNPSGSRTRIAALAAETRSGTRGEQLFGSGIVITAEHVDAALRLP
jgi:hypothetical protein